MKVNNPLVSIAIPTYNRADKNLRSCLESAISQTYNNIEIVVSDNCSNDKTPYLVAEYSDARIRYCRHEKNLGANGNFNFCLAEAKGEYILLLHDDDAIDAEFVETCVEHIPDSEIGFVRTGVRIIDGDGKLLRENKNEVRGAGLPGFLEAWFSGVASVYLCSTLFNRRLLNELGGFKSRHSLLEDAMAIIKMLERAECINLPAVRATFRSHEDQRTFKVNVMLWCEEFGDVLALMQSSKLEEIDKLVEKGRNFFLKICLNRLRYKRSRILKRYNAYKVGRYFRKASFP